MFIFFKDRIELNKLNTKIRALEKFYHGLAKDAEKEGKSRDEIDNIYGELFAERDPLQIRFKPFKIKHINEKSLQP